MLHVRVLLLLLLLFDAARAAVKLNDYILHYETLSYDNSAIHGSHLRAKRSLGKDPFVHINFHAHGRQFHVRVRHDRSVFADNLVVDTPAGKLDDFDISHLYSGSLWGEADTYAFGSIQGGIFDGKIITPKGNYYLERADKYFSPPASLDFHSVIYSEDDVVDAHAGKRAGNGIGCGINHEVRLWMESIQNSAVEEAPSNENATLNDTVDAVQEKVIPKFYEGMLHHKYTKEAQEVVPADESTVIKDDVPPLESHRSKRAVYGINKRACSLYIQTDPLLWDYIHKKENDDTKTREEIASLISQHVKAVNIIYENEDFGGFRGIKFLVQRITINDSSACEGDHRRQQNPFCSNNIDVSNFLNLNSQINHDAFCLAYVFTYRDFTGGTLGLAWVASPQGASGGICEKFKTYTENLGGRHVQTKRSLNTGIITFVNYNSRVPPKVSQLTLAHEIGHNFGSPHDYPLECRPGGQEGNYIMFASATPGDRPNNSKFSTCSRRNITSVLEVVFRIKTGKDNCFIEEDGPFCGNHIVEAGEDCDCGYDDEECTEMCCHPRESKDPEAKPCKHRRGNCSPSEGPCCNHNCEYDENKICRQESDCNLISYCDGYHAQCPPSKPKANGTLCNKETQVCLKGDCVGSICLKYELEECFLSKSPGVTPEQLCEVACQQRGRPTTCQSTFHLQDSAGRNMTGIRLRPGSPCDNFQGFCDVFQKCRAVDAEGPLARLKNLLFNQETLMTISQWVTRYWWGVLMISVAFVVVMGIFIKCCAVHTPSSNPKKAPALRITDTLRRPAATLRRKRRHQTAPQSAMMQGPPPPYPGYPSRSSGGGAAPSRGGGGGAGASGRPRGPGYGEGRGHYNRKKEFMGHGMPYAAAYNPQQQQQQQLQQQRQHRPQSHIEMNHLNV